MYSPDDLDIILSNSEGSGLELKTASKDFDSRERDKYCAAIANAGGGKLILGVNDEKKIIGTSAYIGKINRLSQEIFTNINHTVHVLEIVHPLGRVIVFDIPPRPIGKVIVCDGRYYTRRGESLVAMEQNELASILKEITPDITQTVITGTSISILDEKAIMNFRKLRSEKMGKPSIVSDDLVQVLTDVHLLVNGECTFACIILLGNEISIKKYIPQSEIIFEWRSDNNQIHFDARLSFTAPYLVSYEKIWEAINSRNTRIPFQAGFIQQEIFSFDKKVCREAINNAVMHRDYSRATASIFIHANPQAITVTSPGGLLPGVTVENIRYQSQWRNRLLADVLEHTKLVERSGQGIDDIFSISIKQGKGQPNFEGTDNNQVKIYLPATVQDIAFVSFLEKITNTQQVTLSLEEIIELDDLRIKGLTRVLKSKDKFMQLGIIEIIGKTRGSQYMISRAFYQHQSRMGEFTRLKGLPREAKKQLILEHLSVTPAGAKPDEFAAVFPEMKKKDVSNLLQALKAQGLIEFKGTSLKSKKGVWKLVSN